LGVPSVAELLERLSSRELAEWMAFAELEPFGEERADLRSAIVASTMANAWRGKRQRAFTAEDCMPRFDRSDAVLSPQTAEDMERQAKRIAAILGGSIVEKERRKDAEK
jgi:hypothetical protein